MTTKTPKVKLAQVTWLDAAFTNGYVRPGCRGKLGAMHTSAGHLVRNDKAGVILALTHVADGGQDYRAYLEIPRAYVKGVRILR